MAVDLICPDCGGVIGGKGIDAEGRSPCTCFPPEPDASSDSEQRDSSDTVSIPAPPASNGASAPAVVAPTFDQPAKFCIFCGKNVVGHRRVKDSRGYLCYDCAKKESALQKEGTIPCAECGKRLKEAGLVQYGGVRICKSCHELHREAEKKIIKKVATVEHDRMEKRTIIILSIVLGILGIILIWQALKRFF